MPEPQVRAPPPEIVADGDLTGGDAETVDMRDLVQTLAFDNPDGGAWKQGWEVEARKGDLKVIVLPHSHNDPGWIKTFDDYFQTQTKKILTNVYRALMKDDRRRFIWAEISYFEWWWNEQSLAVQKNMKTLIEERRFDFVTGGWVMPDEANTDIYALEVQMDEGRNWIEEHFGKEALPKYGWSIDPFGYSPTIPYLSKKRGMEGLLIQRVHYAVKKELARKKHLEFMWRQVWDKEGKWDILTHLMPFYSYDVPHTCGPDPSVCCQFDFARLADGIRGCPWHKPPVPITPSNVAERARLLLDQYRKKASLYRSNVVLAPLGDDFRYLTERETEDQFQNYQALIDHVNANVEGVTMQFGTLAEYFEAIKGTFRPPVLKGSFFTYSDINEDYWSGYYTTRPFDKILGRRLESVLYAASVMGASNAEMQKARRTLGLYQHHDGITGTAKNEVVEDYAARMMDSIRFVQNWMGRRLGDEYFSCWVQEAPRRAARDVCRELEKEVVLFNPLRTAQKYCDGTVVEGRKTALAKAANCDRPVRQDKSALKFDPNTGMVVSPFSERWMVWKVKKGGAYLFFPNKESDASLPGIKIEDGGYSVKTPAWSRTIVEREDGAVDFIFETNLDRANQEWFVRFETDVDNDGVFYTDLNGFNFDRHKYRPTLPIQAQVFPMPTHASIEDNTKRFTVLSEHAQGTASLRNGAIDIWLDRRLQQDDGRGLGEGVMDNVLTRTRLRVLTERDVGDSEEFTPTQWCYQLWDELNHPIEAFGEIPGTSRSGKENYIPKEQQMDQKDLLRKSKEQGLNGNKKHNEGEQDHNFDTGINDEKNYGIDVIPFVILAFNRVEYFKQSIASLRKSDFPLSNPILVSIDGHVPEMTQYVRSLQNEFNITMVHHPFSCYDHPDTFPGYDESLNIGYKGDTYHNKRTRGTSCLKHHWMWATKTSWEIYPFSKTIFFTEEDYEYGPSVYSTLVSGQELLTDKYFGMVLENPVVSKRRAQRETGDDHWTIGHFRSGPMAIHRSTWNKLLDSIDLFCKYDDYNWDFSVMHLQNQNLLPYKVIYPSSRQTKHFGLDGLHGGKKNVAQGQLISFKSKTLKLSEPPRKKANKPFGGWGHPKDHEHCLYVAKYKGKLMKDTYNTKDPYSTTK